MSDQTHESNAYLTFLLGDEKFAVHVDHVQEVVELNNVTKVPNTPEYMLGIINLRGKVLPLLDTRSKLGLANTELNKKNRILILDIPDAEMRITQIGAVVDVAREVVEIESQRIQTSESFDHFNHSAPITGIVNNGGDITMIMDITRVFSVNEIKNIDSALS